VAVIVLEAEAERETVKGTNDVPNIVTVEALAGAIVVDEVTVTKTELLNVVTGAMTN